MADPKDETPDVDSSGVYFISIEDFERRPKKKKRTSEDGADVGQEASSEGPESSERE